jgi:hypothetical protein
MIAKDIDAEMARINNPEGLGAFIGARRLPIVQYKNYSGGRPRWAASGLSLVKSPTASAMCSYRYTMAPL